MGSIAMGKWLHTSMEGTNIVLSEDNKRAILDNVVALMNNLYTLKDGDSLKSNYEFKDYLQEEISNLRSLYLKVEKL